MGWQVCGFLLFLLVNICFAQQLPPETINALEELYNSTDGPNWFRNDNWLSSYSPCDPYYGWYGVDCLLHQLDDLSLEGNGLNGTLPSSIFTDISEMEYLYLSYNTLSGTLPDSIGYTTVTRQILLDHNQLIGTLPDTFQQDTEGFFPNLYLDNNQLTGTIPQSFYIVYSTAARFDISDNYFLCPFPFYCDYYDPYYYDCGECYQLIEQVEVDSLTSFYKDTNGPQWKQSTNWLNGNPCDYDLNLQWFGVECVFDEKKHQQQIGSLNLANNGLQGQVILDSLSGLTQLDLSQNDFDPSSLPDLSDSPQLVTLDLSQNNFTGTIPSSLDQLLSLETLNLSVNSLSGILPRSVCGSYYLNLTGNDWACPLPPCCDQATPPGSEPCGSCS